MFATPEPLYRAFCHICLPGLLGSKHRRHFCNSGQHRSAAAVCRIDAAGSAQKGEQMKQDCKNLVGMLTVGLLALAPVFAQSQGAAGSQGAGQSSGAGQSDTHDRNSGSQKASKSGESSTGSANRMGADHAFVTKAAHGGMAEVKLGTLATEKAENADVKAFGQQMVTDHGKANDELKQL